MKKITLLTFALLAVFTLNAQTTMFEEDFDGSGPGISSWTLIDNDGLTPATDVSFITDAWNAIDRDGADGGFGGPAGNFAAMSTSWYTPPGTADDYLISPAIDLTSATSATLQWDAKAQDAAFPDGYEVLVSTSGTDIADFTDVLFSIPAETSTYSTRTEDLSTYLGQTIHIAWRNNSTDKFILIVDDISVSGNLGIQENQIAGFEHFYDNATNMLNLKANEALSQIELYNILGQQVLSEKLSSNEEAVNLSALNTGVYLANVEVNGKRATFKVVKR
ncbi:MAG TPA: choice-of-anchor J domain-containing protein [Flavobacteriaceae bacterium]|nr:choice-of-anchor J domain-containing protein [Flavobacteriaceae bacterium]